MIRRFLTRVLIVILIAACGYNWLQTQRLEGQVAELQARALRPKTGISAKASLSQSAVSLSELQVQWKHLWNHADAFRSTGKKASYHESPI